MLKIVFISLLSFVSSDSLVSASVTEKTSDNENNENDWSFGLGNIPTLGWFYDRVSMPFQFESRPQHEPKSTESAPEGMIKDLDHEEIEKLTEDGDESSDELKSSMKVDGILDMISKSSDDEKKEYMPFLENLQDTLSNNPSRYVKVFLKNMWRVVDLEVFNTSKRRRNEEKVKSLYETIRDFILQIYNAIYNFIAGRFEAGKRGAQKGWAAYERKNEKDPREWSEEKATVRLRELESHYKTMNKEELTKDLTSLCMQPLFTVKFYEEIVTFMDKLKEENVIDKALLDKAFGYVDYKGKFAREHNIGLTPEEIEKKKEEAEKLKHEAEKNHEAEKQKHEAEKQKHEGHEGEKKEHKGK